MHQMWKLTSVRAGVIIEHLTVLITKNRDQCPKVRFGSAISFVDPSWSFGRSLRLNQSQETNSFDLDDLPKLNWKERLSIFGRRVESKSHFTRGGGGLTVNMRPRDSFAREAGIYFETAFQTFRLQNIGKYKTKQIYVAIKISYKYFQRQIIVFFLIQSLLKIQDSETPQNPAMLSIPKKEEGGKTNAKMFWWILLSEFIAYKVPHKVIIYPKSDYLDVNFPQVG